MTAQMTGGQAARPVLHRSRTDRVLAGVCGGLAETYGADPTAVRLLAAIIGIFTGIVPMLVLYLVAAVIIPEDAASDPSTAGDAASGPVTRSRIEPGRGTLVVGIVFIVAGVAALANELFAIDWDLMWPAVLIAFGGLMVLLAMRRDRV